MRGGEVTSVLLLLLAWSPALLATERSEQCPCLPRDKCPRIYGKSALDIRELGFMSPCKEYGTVRCCGVSISVVQADPLGFNPSTDLNSLNSDEEDLVGSESVVNQSPAVRRKKIIRRRKLPGPAYGGSPNKTSPENPSSSSSPIVLTQSIVESDTNPVNDLPSATQESDKVKFPLPKTNPNFAKRIRPLRVLRPTQPTTSEPTPQIVTPTPEEAKKPQNRDVDDGKKDEIETPEVAESEKKLPPPMIRPFRKRLNLTSFSGEGLRQFHAHKEEEEEKSLPLTSTTLAPTPAQTEPPFSFSKPSSEALSVVPPPSLSPQPTLPPNTQQVHIKSNPLLRRRPFLKPLTNSDLSNSLSSSTTSHPQEENNPDTGSSSRANLPSAPIQSTISTILEFPTQSPIQQPTNSEGSPPFRKRFRPFRKMHRVSTEKPVEIPEEKPLDLLVAPSTSTEITTTYPEVSTTEKLEILSPPSTNSIAIDQTRNDMVILSNQDSIESKPIIIQAQTDAPLALKLPESLPATTNRENLAPPHPSLFLSHNDAKLLPSIDTHRENNYVRARRPHRPSEEESVTVKMTSQYARIRLGNENENHPNSQGQNHEQQIQLGGSKRFPIPDDLFSSTMSVSESSSNGDKENYDIILDQEKRKELISLQQNQNQQKRPEKEKVVSPTMFEEQETQRYEEFAKRRPITEEAPSSPKRVPVTLPKQRRRNRVNSTGKGGRRRPPARPESTSTQAEELGQVPTQPATEMYKPRPLISTVETETSSATPAKFVFPPFKRTKVIYPTSPSSLALPGLVRYTTTTTTASSVQTYEKLSTYAPQSHQILPTESPKPKSYTHTIVPQRPIQMPVTSPPITYAYSAPPSSTQSPAKKLRPQTRRFPIPQSFEFFQESVRESSENRVPEREPSFTMTAQPTSTFRTIQIQRQPEVAPGFVRFPVESTDEEENEEEEEDHGQEGNQPKVTWPLTKISFGTEFDGKVALNTPHLPVVKSTPLPLPTPSPSPPPAPVILEKKPLQFKPTQVKQEEFEPQEHTLPVASNQPVRAPFVTQETDGNQTRTMIAFGTHPQFGNNFRPFPPSSSATSFPALPPSVTHHKLYSQPIHIPQYQQPQRLQGPSTGRFPTSSIGGGEQILYQNNPYLQQPLQQQNYAYYQQPLQQQQQYQQPQQKYPPPQYMHSPIQLKNEYKHHLSIAEQILARLKNTIRMSRATNDTEEVAEASKAKIPPLPSLGSIRDAVEVVRRFNPNPANASPFTKNTFQPPKTIETGFIPIVTYSSKDPGLKAVNLAEEKDEKKVVGLLSKVNSS